MKLKERNGVCVERVWRQLFYLPLVALIEVEVLAEAEGVIVGVLVLHPAIKELLKVVEVVLGEAVALLSSTNSIGMSHALMPSVVATNAQENVTAIFLEVVCEISSTSSDVEVGVSAVTSGCALAFLLGDLHEALFTVSANSLWVARTLLHGESRKKDGGVAVLGGIFLKGPDEVLAGLEGTTRLLHGSAEVDRLQLLNSDVRWVPTTTLDATVEEFHVTVRTTGSSDLGSSTTGAARAAGDEEVTTTTGAPVILPSGGS
jgi:hypothetical protein